MFKFMFSVILLTLVALIIIIVLSACLLEFNKYQRTIKATTAVLLLGWIIGDGASYSEKFTHKESTIKQLVSAQPSHTQIEGGIGGNFLFFSGMIQEGRVYLLREEVEEGLYKDFEVRNEVYIREDNTLTARGKFVQYFECRDVHKTYEYFVWTLYDKIVNECFYQKQEIIVPSGSVIKGLNI